MEAAGRKGGEEEQPVDEATQTDTVVGRTKPLHRFIRGEPKCLGIAILLFGCGELLLGIQLMKEGSALNSSAIYIPFWQGALFFTCGILSMYTEVHPSKKMVTVCLAMYVVSLLGVLVSLFYRIVCIVDLEKDLHTSLNNSKWVTYRYKQSISLEAILLTSSLCVSGLLIFLSTVARWALKSSKTQVVVQHALTVLTDLTEMGN